MIQIQKALENKLAALKINGVVVNILDNAHYTDYVIDFNMSVTENKIKSRLTDLGHFLGGDVELVSNGLYYNLRIAKNENRIVWLADFQNDILNSTKGIPLAIGEDLEGNKIYYDLCKMPHLLVAGSTGSGKSVFLHSCIMSALMSQRSALVLIDIKQVEFSMYEGIKTLACPVVNDVFTASNVLQILCDEMDSRYADMKKYHCRDFEEYSKHVDTNYITVVIDELADIMLQNRKAIEKYIIRLAQLGRAAGIHLIVATQRPSADIITSLIKANIPSRICFSVATGIDSRIIIDQKGGENLRGNGDGLFYPIGAKQPQRIQAPYIPTDDIIRITDNARKQP